MDDENPAAGRHPAVLAIVAVAVGAFAIALIAHFVGWWPKRVQPAPRPAVTTQSGVVLLPGETLVAPPDPVAPATAPPASAPPAPAPTAPAAPAAKPKPAPRPPTYAKPAPAKPTPAKPETRYARTLCVNCAVVTGISRGDYAWEVSLRFDDGSRETMRYYDPPRVNIGDAVHIEEGRMVRR